MKIVHLTSGHENEGGWGGIAVARDNYILMAKRLGYQTAVLSLNRFKDSPEQELLDALEKEKPDLVHIHDCQYRVSFSLADEIVNRFATISTAYDVGGVCLTGRKVMPDNTFCEEPLSRFCLEKHCPTLPSWGFPDARNITYQKDLAIKQRWLEIMRRGRVLVHSRYMRRQYEINGFWPADLHEVLPVPGIPFAREIPSANSEDMPPRLLYVGRLDMNKGVYLLPEVLERLPGRWCLDVVGAGREAESLRQYFYKKGLKKQVRFHGFCLPGELVGFYDRAAVLLIPSLVPESFCQVGVEAMGRGLPVVAAEVGAISDWMVQGKTGFMVPPGDPDAMASAVWELVLSSGLQERCRRGALNQVRQLYANRRVEKQLSRAYEHSAAMGREGDGKNEKRKEDMRIQGKEKKYTLNKEVENIVWLTGGRGSRILVVAPHFDDEILGCGGALAAHVSAGNDVHVLFLTDGSLGGLPGYERERKTRVRMTESRRALQHLGVSQVECLGMPDGTLGEQPELSNRLKAFIEEHVPDIIYAPHPGEWCPDHKAAARAICRAAAGMGSIELRLYEIWSPLAIVNAALDITPLEELKRKAIMEFRSQLAEFDYEEAVSALNVFRGRSLGKEGITHAEAFYVIDAGQLDSEEWSKQFPSPSPVSRKTNRFYRGFMSRPGKRVVVYSESPHSPTGFGQVVKNIIPQLSHRFDLDITLLVPHLWPGDIEEPFRIFPIKEEKKFTELLEQLDFDIFFQIKDVYGNAMVSEAVRSLRRRGKSFFSLLYTPIEGELCHRHLQGVQVFDHIVLYNNFSRSVLERCDPSLTVKERCSIIPHGVNLIEYYPYSSSSRREARQAVLPHHVFSENRFTILNINRNYQRKDLPRCLLVLKEVMKAEPNVYMHLHTHPFEGDFELIEIARELGISARNLGFSCQHFGRNSQPLGHTGYDYSEINRLYNCADLVISTSVGEGHGFSTTEAMACRVPFVGPDNTSFKELLADGRGFLVPCARDVDSIVYHPYMEPTPRFPVSVKAMTEAIVRIIRGESDVKGAVERAYEYVQRLNWENVREQWFTLFENIRESRKK